MGEAPDVVPGAFLNSTYDWKCLQKETCRNTQKVCFIIGLLYNHSAGLPNQYQLEAFKKLMQRIEC